MTNIVIETAVQRARAIALSGAPNQFDEALEAVVTLDRGGEAPLRELRMLSVVAAARRADLTAVDAALRSVGALAPSDWKSLHQWLLAAPEMRHDAYAAFVRDLDRRMRRSTKRSPARRLTAALAVLLVASCLSLLVLAWRLPARAPAMQSAPPAQPAGDAFKGGTSEAPSFGSGAPPAEPNTQPLTAPATTQPSSPPAQPVAPTPAPTPTPTPPPVMAPAPQSQPAMWDTQVNLLREAIDLRARVDQLAATPSPDQATWLGMLDTLMKQSREVSAEAKTVDKSLKELRKSTHRLVTLDNEGKRKPGIAEDLATEKSSASALSADTMRQIALLMARFEQAATARTLISMTVQHPELKADALVLKALTDPDLDRLSKWPSTPFNGWYVASSPATKDTPLASHIPLMASMLAGVLDPMEGAKLLEQLKREQSLPAAGGMP